MGEVKLTAKQYLEQIQEIDICINQDLTRIAEMKTNASGNAAIDYSKDKVRASPKNTQEILICNYAYLEEKLNAKVDQFINAKEQVINEIRGLHNKNYINVLYKIYVEYKNIRQVASEMSMSYSYTLELHKKALETFEKTYKNLSYLT